MNLYSLKAKIIFLSIIGMFGMVMIGGIGQYAQNFIQQENEIGHLSQAASGVIADIIRTEERYIRSAETERIEESKNHRARFAEIVAMMTASTEDVQIRELSDSMKQAEADSAPLFASIVANTLLMNTAQEELRATLQKFDARLEEMIKQIDDEEAEISLNGDAIAAEKAAVRNQFKQLFGIRNEIMLNLVENLFLEGNVDKYGVTRENLKKKIDLEIKNVGIVIQAVNIDAFSAGWRNAAERLTEIEAVEKKIADLRQENQVAIGRIIAAGEKAKTIANQIVDLGKAKVARAENVSKLIIAVAVGLVVLFMGMVGFLIYRSFSGPIARTIELAEAIRRGDLSRRLQQKRRDEIGRLSMMLDAMADSLEAKGRLAEKIANGDLTHEVQLSSAEDSLGKSLQSMSRNLNQILSQIDEAVHQVSSGSGQVSDSSQALSQGATEQASSLEEITSSMTEIGSQTTVNAAGAGQAEALTVKASQAAQEGVKQMQSVTEAMGAITESSKEIRKIISTIEGIAFQTNLLALNAAVEAARAGKHGKGFAVVAQEVRNLAGRSAKAAEETTRLIETTVKRIADGEAVVGTTAQTLSQIHMDVTKVAQLVGEIASASNEQAQGISQINQGLAQIDGVTQQNTAHAEETSAAAEELASQAAHVKDLLRRFTLNRQEGDNFENDSRSREDRALPPPSNAWEVVNDPDISEGWGCAEKEAALNCWEFKKCGREAGGAKAAELGVCPAYPHQGRNCARIAGTLCGGKVQGSFATKLSNCMTCEYYKSPHYERRSS